MYSLLLALFVVVVSAQNTNLYLQTSRYQGLEVYGCSRLLNNTNTVGCQAAGTSGILKAIRTRQELEAFKSQTGGPYVIITSYALFNKENMNTLRQTGMVNAVVLLKDVDGFDKPTFYSADFSCPNCQFLNEQVVNWNPTGSGMAFEDFDFPIFSMWNKTADPYQNHINAILSAESSNQKGSTPYYSAELNGFMNAGTNSLVCLSRRRCDPIGGYSIWSSFSELAQKTSKPTILVSTMLDSFSFIRDISVGASVKTGVVALVAIADALKNASPNSLAKQFLFTFFDAEKFSFAGSQRFIQDISTDFTCKSTSDSPVCIQESQNACSEPCYSQTWFSKINFDSIESIVEIQSVGLGPMYTHFFDDSVNLAKAFEANIGGGQSISPSKQRILPPSSAMSFLKKKKIPAVVLSDFDSVYSNPFVNSEFDDGSIKPSVDLICGMVNATANALYSLASGGSTSPSVAANCTLVSELLDCLIYNISCPLMNRFASNKSEFYVIIVSGISQTTSYPGGFSLSSMPTLRHFLVKGLMHNITALERGGNCAGNSTLCDNNSGFYCVAGQCVRSRTHYQAAYPIGVEWDYVAGWWKVVDSKLLIWTESRWDKIQMRIFKSASSFSENIQLVLGILSSIVSYFLVRFMKKYLNKHMKND